MKSIPWQLKSVEERLGIELENGKMRQKTGHS